jgi:hypothetical protein
MSPTALVWADPSAPDNGPIVDPSIISPDQPSGLPVNSQIPEAPIIPNFADIMSQVPVVPSAPTLDVPKSPPSGPIGGFGGGIPPSNTKLDSSTATLDLAAAAKVTKETDKDGQVVTKVAVDASKLEQAFSEKIQIVVVEINGIDPIAKVDLPTNALLQAAAKQPNALVQIKVNEASYHLPVSVFRNLPKDTAVNVTITKLSDTKSVDLNAKIEQQGSVSVLDKPVDFTVSINGEEVTDFHGAYVDRSLSFKSLTDPSKATAVWIDANNKMNFVPSVISTNNGSVEVTIHSPHNSIYTVIQSNKSFADMQGHWAKSDVEYLANKLIVDGITDTNFGPDKNITRAEFAAFLVRSMGLIEVKSETAFTDVKAADWYAGAVGAAQKAGFIAGYEDGTFRPNAKVTREQMVSMIIRAMKAVGKEIKANPSVLSKFSDQPLISDWAKEAVSESLSIGLIQGTTDTTFAAQDQATRAQAVSVLKRALQVVQFVN